MTKIRGYISAISDLAIDEYQRLQQELIELKKRDDQIQKLRRYCNIYKRPLHEIEVLFGTFCSTMEFRFVGCSILTNGNRGINDGEYDLLGVMMQIRLMYN